MRIVDNFDPYVGKPIDSRYYVSDKTEMSVLGRSSRAYDYMIVLCKADGNLYQLHDNQWSLIKAPKVVTYSGSTDSYGNIYNLTGVVVSAESVSIEDNDLEFQNIKIPKINLKDVEKQVSIDIEGTIYTTTITVREPEITEETKNLLVKKNTLSYHTYVGIPYISGGKSCVHYECDGRPLSGKEITVKIYYYDN